MYDAHFQVSVAGTAKMIVFRVTTMSHNTCKINSINLSITSAFTWTKLSHPADGGSMLLQNAAAILLSPTYVHKYIIVKYTTTKFSENENRSRQHVTKDAKYTKYSAIQTSTIKDFTWDNQTLKQIHYIQINQKTSHTHTCVCVRHLILASPHNKCKSSGIRRRK